MKKIGWLGVITGGVSGLVASVLISYDWSVLSVSVVGALIGLIIGYFKR